MMNIKSFHILAFLIALLFLFPTNTFAANNVSVYIDNQPVNFTANSGVPFEDSNYRTLVPLRITMEAAGCDVSWNQSTNTATLIKDGTTVTITIGQQYITKNGEKIVIDTKAIEKQNRIYLPIRAVLEAFGANIEYNNNNIRARFSTLPNKTTEEYLILSYFESYMDNEICALEDLSNGLDNYPYVDEYFNEAKAFWRANTTLIQNIINECGNDAAGIEIKQIFTTLGDHNRKILSITDFRTACEVATDFSKEQRNLMQKVLNILENM